MCARAPYIYNYGVVITSFLVSKISQVHAQCSQTLIMAYTNAWKKLHCSHIV